MVLWRIKKICLSILGLLIHFIMSRRSEAWSSSNYASVTKHPSPHGKEARVDLEVVVVALHVAVDARESVEHLGVGVVAKDHGKPAAQPVVHVLLAHVPEVQERSSGGVWRYR